MAYFAIEDFKSGLDVRRSPYTSVAGTLQKLVNAHITRGGDIERRKAFVDQGALASTFGLASDIGGKVVFGSDLTPGGVLPTGVRYQRLVAPTGANMTRIAAAKQYGGKLYVVADYDDGTQWHFYDGELVNDWGGGVVTANMTTVDDIATHLAGLIDDDPDFTATATGATIEVVGLDGVDYDVGTTVENVSGGTDDQALSVAFIDEAIAEVPATQAIGEFAILSGSVDPANTIDAVDVDTGSGTTNLLSSPVAFVTSPEYTAAAVAAAINTGTGTHGYDAEAKYGKVFVYAPGVDGDDANGRVLQVKATGNVILYNGSFTITAGSNNPGANAVSSVKANGLEILGSSVDWATSNAATAAAVAAQICAYASSPKFNAYAEGAIVFVSPETVRSDDPTTITLAATSIGDVEFGPGGTPQVIDQYPDYNDAVGCVSIGSYLPNGGLAGNVMVGETLQLADPETLEPREGVVSRSDRSIQSCWRIVTAGGATLICSDTAPIPVRAGGYRFPQQLMGHEVAVLRDGVAGWELVVDIVGMGKRYVQNITVENANFWAGERAGVYILHHNRKATDFGVGL